MEDPHNLGAIIRTADAAGADGIVIPERRAVGVTGTVAKVSAGASGTLADGEVTNIRRTLEELKQKNCGLSGSTSAASKLYDEIGLHRWIARWCSAPRARACTNWCASTAISWCRSLCSGRCRR